MMLLLSTAFAASVLIIYDTTGGDTATLKTALEGEGHTVTYSSTSESSYNGSNPSPSSYDVVIHLNGTTYSSEMPSAGQAALLAYVSGGGGFIHGEWNAYQIDSRSEMSTMEPITLLKRTSGQCSTLTYTVSDDGYVDIEAPDGTRFAIGENWDQRVARLETILETGYDTGNGELSWPAKAENNDQ